MQILNDDDHWLEAMSSVIQTVRAPRVTPFRTAIVNMPGRYNSLLVSRELLLQGFNGEDE